jgi:hypothetical protein
VCMQPVREGTSRKLPPIATANGDANIEARATEARELVLDPYPFSTDPVEFSIPATVTSRTKWDDEPAFRRDVRAGHHAVVEFTCRSG